MQIKIVDPGHTYDLHQLDAPVAGWWSQRLTFVKRIGPKFPGNTGFAHRGTTMQFGLRALIDRLRYVNGQEAHWVNGFSIWLLKIAIWCLEYRAASRHGLRYFKSLDFASSADMCEECGHTVCKHKSF